MSKSVQEPEVRELFESGAGSQITIFPIEDPRGERWTVSFKIGLDEFSIASQREKTRTWASINTTVHWLKRLGIKDAVLKIA